MSLLSQTTAKVYTLEMQTLNRSVHD